MSRIFATQLSAITTAILPLFAVVFGIFTFLAFRKQSEEVRAIERQVQGPGGTDPAAGRAA